MIKLNLFAIWTQSAFFVWQQIDPKILNTAIFFICSKKYFFGDKIYVALGDLEPTV